MAKKEEQIEKKEGKVPGPVKKVKYLGSKLLITVKIPCLKEAVEFKKGEEKGLPEEAAKWLLEKDGPESKRKHVVIKEMIDKETLAKVKVPVSEEIKNPHPNFQ